METMDSLKSINSNTRKAYNIAAEKHHVLFHNEMNEKEYDRNLLDSFADRFSDNSLICDAGCGPSGQIGRYLFEKGFNIIGIDISEKCVQLARQNNPGMKFECGDIGCMPFKDRCFDGVISYYSIIDTPKRYLNKIFSEFRRVLKPGGYLLVAVKAGKTEGYIYDLLDFKTKVYFTLFSEEEITGYFNQAGFFQEFIEKRNPYDFEITNERIFAIGKKFK